MFQNIYLQRFADLLGTTCLQCAVDFVDGAAKGVVFAATNTYGAKTNGGQVCLLFLKRFLERQQIIRDIARTMCRGDN